MNENKYRIVEFEEILKMKQMTLKRHLEAKLEAAGYEPKSEDGFLYAEGTFPVLLVAHMDTVHKECVQKIKYNGAIMSSPQGIGGDDRCGIYAILQIIKDYHCSVLFTEDEEIGCVGSGKFAKSDYVVNNNINYIIEIDRRGTNDCVFYSCDNPDFKEFIESTGYFKTEWGSVSDISIIAPVLQVAAVNLSSGYFNEHTITETINVEALLSTIEEAKKILALPCEEPFEYIEAAYGYGKYGNWWKDWDDEEETSPISTDYTTAYTDSGVLMFSNEKAAKKYFHVYLLGYKEEEICCEVLAVNEMEAIGIVLSHYQYYSVCDIIDIKSAA
jgi:hypothetical protein